MRCGLCDLGYTQAQLINGVQVGQMQQGYETRIAVNGVGQKLSDCCCDIKQEIAGVNNGLGRAIERGFCDTNYNLQAQHNATMIAIDKVGDRVIDYLNSTRMQDLQAENQALRMAASQQAQNNFDIGGQKDGTRDTADAGRARGYSGRAGTGDPDAEQGAPGMAADGSDGIPRCRVKKIPTPK